MSSSQSGATLKEEDIRNWFDVSEKYFIENDLLSVLREPDRVFNCDESAFFLTPKGNKVLAPKGDRTVYQVSGNSDREAVTVLMTVNAAGMILPPMIVYRCDRIPSEVSNAVPEEWGMGRSKSGWMTSGTFFEYITNIFEPWLTENNVKRPVVLFLDGHASHLTIELSDFCVLKQIEVIPLYPNATHVLQPLDVGIFHPFKVSYRDAVTDWRFENDGARITKVEFPAILAKAMECITPAQIQSAFRTTGICPFSVNSIDFSKLILTKNKSTDVSITPVIDDLSSTSLLPIQSVASTAAINEGDCLLNEIENEITPEMLTRFKECSSPSSVAVEDKSLFKLWYRLRASSQESSVSLSLDSSRRDLSPVASSSRTSDLSFTEPTTSSALIETALSSSHSSDLSPINPCHSTPVRVIPPVQTYAEDFSSALRWPSLADVDKNTTGKQKRAFPLAITSKAWQKHHQEKEAKRKEQENEKERKKLERLKKKEEKEEAKKMKGAKKKDQIKLNQKGVAKGVVPKKQGRPRKKPETVQTKRRRQGRPRKKPETESSCEDTETSNEWTESDSESFSPESFDEDEMRELAEKMEQRRSGRSTNHKADTIANSEVDINLESVEEDDDQRKFDVGDWVIVKYDMTQQNTRFRNFLGQILKQHDDGKFEGKFLRAAPTKDNSGFVYKHPQEDDIGNFSPRMVVAKVDAPKPFGRQNGLLLFNIHSSNL